MNIEGIRLRNYRSFRDASIEGMPSLCVFLGANGTGKSTLFGVFGFLQDAMLTSVRRAVQSRGGLSEIRSRGVAATQPVRIELRFKFDIAKRERLVTYFVEIGERSGRPVVEREVLRYKRGEYGAPFHFLDFRNGKGSAITNEEDFDKPDEELSREEQQVDEDALAISGLGQFARFKAANALRKLIEDWQVSDLHITEARGVKSSVGYDEHLSASGDNLQLVARNIHENHPEIFREILEKMHRRIPGLAEVVPMLTEDSRLLLQFRDGAFEDPFIDRFVSDGTMKMFAYLVLLHDPEPHPLLCVEEPENQLHPRLLEELAEEFRAYSQRGGQVLVSTHSPDFVNALKTEEVFWLVKHRGYTSIARARDDRQVVSYMNDGDKLGYLWKQGFLTGADPTG